MHFFLCTRKAELEPTRFLSKHTPSPLGDITPTTLCGQTSFHVTVQHTVLSIIWGIPVAKWTEQSWLYAVPFGLWVKCSLFAATLLKLCCHV